VWRAAVLDTRTLQALDWHMVGEALGKKGWKRTEDGGGVTVAVAVAVAECCYDIFFRSW